MRNRPGAKALTYSLWAVLLLGPLLVACSDDASPETSSTSTPGVTTTTVLTDTSSIEPPPEDQTTSSTQSTDDTATPNAIIQPGFIEWEPIDFGDASAYLVIRDDLAALVDVGPASGVADIEKVLTTHGLGWANVIQVVLTHGHSDVAGGVEEVMRRAPHIAVAASSPTVTELGISATAQEVSDGVLVFGLQVVATPGHTPGHLSYFEPVGGILFAGDAIRGGDAAGQERGDVVGPDPGSTDDADRAAGSIAILAGLDVETILFSHGAPVEDDARTKLIDLANRT